MCHSRSSRIENTRKYRHADTQVSPGSLCISARISVCISACAYAQPRDVVRMTAEECASDAIVIARGRVFSERMPIQSSFISLAPPFSSPSFLLLPPLFHLFHPSRTPFLFGSFLAVHPRNLWTIREEREKTAGREGRFDKSLLVKRPPDCRERDQDEGAGGV